MPDHLKLRQVGTQYASRWVRATVAKSISREVLTLYAWFALNLAFSLLCAALLVELVQRLNTLYYKTFPFFGDTFSYFARRLRDALIIEEYGRNAVWALAAENQRNPLTSLTLGLYPASAMKTINGFAIYNAGCYAAFSFMLSHVVWRRTGLWSFALATVGLTVAFGMFFDPTYGASSELPDMPAAFLAGAAVLALVASERGDRPVWILWFAVFAGLATLSRISASMYVFALGAPLVAAYFFRMLVVYGIARFAWVGVLSVVILLLISGRFLYENFLPTLEFYRIAGYGLNADIFTAFSTTAVPFFSDVVGVKYWPLVIPALIWVLNVRKEDVDWWSLVETAWLVLAVPILLAVVLKQRDDYTQMYFAIPGVALLACAPFALRKTARWGRWAGFRLTILLPLAAAASYGAIAFDNYRNIQARHPSMSIAEQRIYQHNVADIFVAADGWSKDQVKQGLANFDAAFDYYWRYVIPALQFDYKTQIRWRPSFQIRESQWELVYGNLPLAQQHQSFLSDISMNLNAMAVLSDPEAPEAFDALKDQRTIDWAIVVRDHVREPANGWIKLGETDGPHGDTEVYVNHIKRLYDNARLETALQLRAGFQNVLDEFEIENKNYTISIGLELPRPYGPLRLLPADDVRHQVYSFVLLVSALSTRLPIPEAAAQAVAQLHNGHAALALPVIPEASDLQRYLLNETNVKIIKEIAATLEADTEAWIPGGTVQTTTGEFAIFLNRHRLYDR